MADLADLEARIRVLEDVEAIKKLKSKYFRAIDKKLWDELADCWSEDAMVDWSPKMKFEGSTAIVDFFRDTLKDSAVGVHQGHNAEIDITSETTAKGVWELWDQTIDVDMKAGMRVFAFYEDEYVKEKGDWKIKVSKLVLIRRERLIEVDGEWKMKS